MCIGSLFPKIDQLLKDFDASEHDRTVIREHLREPLLRFIAAGPKAIDALDGVDPEAALLFATDEVTAFLNALQSLEDRLGTAAHRTKVACSPSPESEVPCFINRAGVISEANDAFAQLLGAPNAAAIIGRSPADFIDPTFHEQLRARLARLWAGGVLPTWFPELIRLDGTRVTAKVDATLFMDGNLGVRVHLRPVACASSTDQESLASDQPAPPPVVSA